MENCYFFNYDKLYSEEDDIDLNEQRLNEFNEEELETWDLKDEITLKGDIIPKEQDDAISVLSRLIERDEEDEASVDLSQESNGASPGNNRDNGSKHFITKYAFEERFK